MNQVPQQKFLRHAIRDGLSLNHKSSFWMRVHLDPWLLGLLVINALLGLVVLYSASAESWTMVGKQAMSFSIGFIVLFICAQIPPKVYQAASPYLYILGVVLLMLVLVIGDSRLGAKRWISIPGFGSMQPSELMKFSIPLMITWYITRHTLPPKFKHIVIAIALMMCPLILIALQPDLGAGILILVSGVFVLFLSGMSWFYIIGAVGFVIALMPLLWMFVLHSYQKKRILTLFDPESDALGAGWNITQSKIAIGSGGFMGKGYLNGTQSHHGFLPEHHTDFIMSTYAEEFGLVGVFGLFVLYACIIIRSLNISLNSFHNFGRILVATLALSFFFFVAVNSGMVSGIFPVTGDPLPFMSYGGTAVITLLAGFGIIMSVHTHR